VTFRQADEDEDPSRHQQPVPADTRPGAQERPFLAVVPESQPEPEITHTRTSGLERPNPIPPVVVRRARETIYRRSLALADAIGAVMIVLVAAWLAGVRPTPVIVCVPLFAVFVAKVQGLYDRDDMVIHKSTLAEWRVVAQCALFTSLATFAAWHVVTDSTASRGGRLLAFLIVGTFVALVLLRTLARRQALRVGDPERCAIIGDPEQCEALALTLGDMRGVQMVGVIANSGFDSTIEGVQELIEALGVERVIVGPYAPWRETHALDLIRSLKWLGVRVTLMPSIMGVVGGATVADMIDGTVLLGVPAFGMTRSSIALKRSFDLVGGVIASAVALVPGLILALWIKLDSPGPVIFSQTRIGRNGQPFTMYKFRSMVVDAEERKADLHHRNEATNGLFKMEDDPRVTRVGRFMRKSYLDEIPQLYNILRGDMSLVGPRPLIHAEDTLLTGSDRHRLVLVPGLTGPWQLRGPLEASLPELAKLDYLYASNWSIWRDVDIILGTILRVINRGGH